MRVFGVIGANYGDEGKGMVSAHIRHHSDPAQTVTILTNGGAQRGHTVDSFDHRFVFHHLGASQMGDCNVTYCPAPFVINPMVLAQDLRDIKSWCPEKPVVYINPECLVTTPFDMMANQIEELAASCDASCKGRWGSTGMGVWHTKQRSRFIKLTAGELFTNVLRLPGATEDTLLRICDYWKDRMFIYKSTPFPGYDSYAELFETGMLITRWVQDVIELSSLVHIGSPFGNGLYTTAIFENAQGLMLSQERGEHSTSSVTGARAIADIVAAEKLCDPKDVRLCYVSRTYVTRHGDGPLPLECPQELLHTEMVDKTNVWNQWQGSLRYGIVQPGILAPAVVSDISKAGMSRDEATVVMTHTNEVPYRLSLNMPVVEVDNPYMTEDHGIV